MNDRRQTPHHGKEKSLTRPGLIIPLISAVFFFVASVPAQPSNDQSGYRLIGTIEGADFTGAVLIDAAGNQSFYRIREPLPDGSQIVKVHNDHISLKRSDGTRYELFIIHHVKPASQQARPPASASPPVSVNNGSPAVSPYRPPVTEQLPGSVVQGTGDDQRDNAGPKRRSRQTSSQRRLWKNNREE